MKKEHDSYGMISISRFYGNNSQFFGSDLNHSGGISITISKASVKRDLHQDWFHGDDELIEVNLSNTQFIDAITSEMNSSGVPCTLKHFNHKKIPQIDHVDDKRDLFRNGMEDTQKAYLDRIDCILEMMDGNIGKRKSNEIKRELSILKNWLSSNTPFVMDQFNKAMDKSVQEAKQSVEGYISHKVNRLGMEALRNQLEVSISDESSSNIDHNLTGA